MEQTAAPEEYSLRRRWGAEIGPWFKRETWNQPIVEGANSAPSRSAAMIWLAFMAIPIGICAAISLGAFLGMAAGCLVIATCYFVVVVLATSKERRGLRDWRLIPMAVLVGTVVVLCIWGGGSCIYLILYAVMPSIRVFGPNLKMQLGMGLLAAGLGLAMGAAISDILIVLLMGAAAVWSAFEGFRVAERDEELREHAQQMTIAKERARFARDLHDLLGHSLSVIALKCEVAGRLMEIDQERARAEMAEIEGVARRALREVREAVTGYRETTIAVELAGSRSTLASAGISWTEHIEDFTLGRQAEGIMAWALREAVTNVIRHSSAHHCEIALRGTAQGGSTLSVTDDGACDESATGGLLAGNGLRGLHERVASVGGEVVAGPRPQSGAGWRVAVTLPPCQGSTQAEARPGQVGAQGQVGAPPDRVGAPEQGGAPGQVDSPPERFAASPEQGAASSEQLAEDLEARRP